MQAGRAQGLAPVLISTGISSVVLIGDFAYKLRKPLKLDFLDFSTLEQRRLDCLAELALNQRTAPQLYLDVVAVRGSQAEPHWAPVDDARPLLDWALRMRRFDPDQGYDRLAARGALRAAHVDALAQHVAAFHAQLPPSPGPYGHAEQALRWAQANFEVLNAHALSLPWQARLSVLASWTQRQFDTLSPCMAARRLAGWVREGHGDLHLGNILWQDGQAYAFDAIEFNAELRHVDVIDDFAFVWMDLHRQGLPRLAARCLNSYLSSLGDLGGLPLLRWYAVYRALVRAKVALLRAVQAQALGHSFEPDLQALDRDIAVAEQLSMSPATKPLLVLTTGLSGSGKSTVAARLVETLGALCLRSDVERKRLHGLSPEARGGAAIGLYSAEATTRTYAQLDALARQGLHAAWPTVVDAACLKRSERDHFRALAHEAGADFVLLCCEAPVDVLRARIAHRAALGHDASDATAAVLEQQLQWQEPVLAEETACHLSTA